MPIRGLCVYADRASALVLCMQGDVYHLLFNLGEWLDGRVWPEQDELDVLRLLDLIHHVTGNASDAVLATMIFTSLSWLSIDVAAAACLHRKSSYSLLRVSTCQTSY